MDDHSPTIQRQIRLRRVMRWTWRIGVPALLLTAILDRCGAFGYRGDDWRRFDRKTVIVQKLLAGDQFQIEGNTLVQLLGVAAPEDEPLRQQSIAYTRSKVEGRSVLLWLDVPQTRDERGHLLAYVYLSESDCFNVDLIKDGWAFADRRVMHLMRPACEAAESDARKKKRGLWAEITDQQMPLWRQQWLAQRKN